MRIDVKKLRAVVNGAEDLFGARWRLARLSDADVTYGEIAALLDVYEAAQAWRERTHGMTTLSGPERVLARAVDEASKETP